MFHVEHCVGAAVMRIAAALAFSGFAFGAPEGIDSSLVGQDSARANECFVVLPQGHDDIEAAGLTNAALQELLLGDRERALSLLQGVLQRVPESPLAHAALLATGSADADETLRHAEAVREAVAGGGMVLTPAEETAISWLLELACGDYDEALRLIQEHTHRYRNDVYTRCWEALLLHYSGHGYDVLGQAAPEQVQAEQVAQTLFTDRPEDALVCFTRALVEEGRPVPTPEACTAAQRAAAALPHHPVVLQLCAHLLFRSGMVQEALVYINRAIECCDAGTGEENVVAARWIELRLYQATLYTILGRDAEALAVRRKLNALPLLSDVSARARADQMLLRWEAHTLPLRILFMPGASLTSSRINAAFQTATFAPDVVTSGAELQALSLSRDCLTAALRTMKQVRSRRQAQALLQLRAAEKAADQLRKLDAAAFAAHPLLKRYLSRQLEACAVALSLAKAALYPEEKEVWEEAVRDATRAPSVLMPPVIPRATVPVR